MRGASAASIGEPNAKRMCERVWMGSCPLYTHERANGSKGRAPRRGRGRRPKPKVGDVGDAASRSGLRARYSPSRITATPQPAGSRRRGGRSPSLPSASASAWPWASAFPSARVRPPPAPPARGPRSRARPAGRPAFGQRARQSRRQRARIAHRLRATIVGSAAGQVRGARSALRGVERVQRQCGNELLERSAVHGQQSSSVASSLASFPIASFTRILTVPSGLPVFAAISLWLNPSK